MKSNLIVEPGNHAHVEASIRSETSQTSASALPGVAIGLGVVGVPESSSQMLLGGVYALKVKTSSARFPLLVSSLESALGSGLCCTVITALAPEDFIHRLEAVGNFSVAPLINDGRLLVFSTQDEFSKKMFRFGAERLTEELEQFEIPNHSFLIFDQADDLLSLHDLGLASQQIRVLSKWFRLRHITGLLAFTRSTGPSGEALNALLDFFTGIAKLGGDRDGIELTFVYWKSPVGVIAAENFNLFIGSDNRYNVSRRKVERIQQLDDAPNEIAFIRDEQAPSLPSSQSPVVDSPKPLPLPEPRSRVITQLSSQVNTPQVTEPNLVQALRRFYFSDARLIGLQKAFFGEWFPLDSLSKPSMAVQNSNEQNSNDYALLFYDGVKTLSETAQLVHNFKSKLGLKVRVLICLDNSGSSNIKELDLSTEEQHLLLRCGADGFLLTTTSATEQLYLLKSLERHSPAELFEPDFKAILSSAMRDSGLVLEASPIALPPQERSISYHRALHAEPVARRAIQKAKRSALPLANNDLLPSSTV